MHFDRKSRHLFHIQSLVFSVPSPLLLPEIVCTSSSDTGFRALTKIPRRFRDWGITSVKSLMDSENISGKGWSTQLSCEGSKLRYPDARFLSIFYGDAVDSRQNSWSYLKHGNAMVGYDHFWGFQVYQTAVLQEDPWKLKWKRPKFEQSNHPVGIWRCLTSWEIREGMFLQGLKTILI